MIKVKDPFGNITYTLNIIELNSTRHKSKSGETHTVKSSENNIVQEFCDGNKPNYSNPPEPENFWGSVKEKLSATEWEYPFKEEAYKETEGKIDYSEVNLDILDIAAERFTANKHKYPVGNMKKPLDKNNLTWAMFRHVKKMLQPSKGDTESYTEHLAAVICNASMILDQLKIEEENANN